MSGASRHVEVEFADGAASPAALLRGAAEALEAQLAVMDSTVAGVRPLGAAVPGLVGRWDHRSAPKLRAAVEFLHAAADELASAPNDEPAPVDGERPRLRVIEGGDADAETNALLDSLFERPRPAWFESAELIAGGRTDA